MGLSLLSERHSMITWSTIHCVTTEIEPVGETGSYVGETDPFFIPDALSDDEAGPHKPRWWYAAQLRVAGASWGQIAEALGYRDVQKAASVVRAKMTKAQATADLREVIDLELERLDALQLTCWRTARQGDQKSIDLILKIMERRSKLLGLDRKPETETVSQTNNTMIVIGGSESDYIAALRQARVDAKAIEG